MTAFLLCPCYCFTLKHTLHFLVEHILAKFIAELGLLGLRLYLKVQNRVRERLDNALYFLNFLFLDIYSSFCYVVDMAYRGIPM